MTEDKEPARERRPPPRRRDDSERALGLEMARLFGMSPKQMMAPKPKPEASQAPEDDPEHAEADEEPSSDSG